MRTTKDQKELSEILALAVDARNTAYSLLARRLDTQRNIDSFILLRDAFNLLKKACEALAEAENKATDTKATSLTTVMDEIMIRSGRAQLVDDDDAETSETPTQATVLPFPKKE